MAKASESVIYEDGCVYVLGAGTPIYVKTADICAVIGKSNQWVGQLTARGTLNKTKTPHGSLFHLGDNLRAYCEMLEDRADSEDADPEEEEIERNRKQAEAEIKTARATMAKLDAAEREGKMHRSEDVAAMTEDLIFAIRGDLNALPGRLAVEVASLSDPAEVAEAIRREVYAIMEELSHYRYDSRKYEERVRQRLNLEVMAEDDGDDPS